MRKTHTRREILRSLALGAGSLTFGGARPYEFFTSARAAATATPKRIVIFPIANGVSETGGHADFGVAGTTPTSFTLGPMLKPLETLGLRDQLVCIDNIEMKREIAPADFHFAGLTQVLVGPYSTRNRESRSAGISIDNYLGSKISKGLPFERLYMGTMCGPVSYSYLANGNSVPSNSNPLVVYNQVFGRGLSGDNDPNKAALLMRRKSILDTVSSDLRPFLSGLPNEDRERAEVQLNAIREMERQLASTLPVSSACKIPTLDRSIDYSLDDNFPKTMRAIIDLTVASLACDQTRVVMFHSYAREYHPPEFGCPWEPVKSPEAFHSLSHLRDPRLFQLAKAFHYQLAGELANKLKAIPEPSGEGTMLDNTVIFIPTEIGKGHTGAGLQFCTIGGRRLGVNTGRYLQLGTNRNSGGGVAHQRLLVGLLNAVGLDDTKFGDTTNSGSGPLSGFLAA